MYNIQREDKMGYYEKLCEIKRIKDCMMDEESEILFDARIDYMITRDADQFYKVIDQLDKSWYCKEVMELLRHIKYEGIIVFGCGHDGKRTKKILEKCGYTVEYFCDSNKKIIGKYVDGLRVISVEKLTENYSNYVVILGSQYYAEEMYQILLSKAFPLERIMYSKYKMIVAQCGKQYFDIFPTRKDEVFIDGGSYNGDTIFEFLKWTKGEYNKIYAFEPMGKMCELIGNKIKKQGIKNFELFQNALWSKREELCIKEGGAGSRVEKDGTYIVEGVSIDEIVKDEIITYIKLDVEGSEMKALEGAKNTIMRNRPKLAISIYHKTQDIIEIPVYILELVPEYKFYIRHYCSNTWETILYAEV